MGKRIEKAFGKDKGQTSQSSQEVEEDPNKTPGTLALLLNHLKRMACYSTFFVLKYRIHLL